MTLDQWIGEFARQLEIEPPSDEELDQILKLAAIAAHGSERTAAPVACWIGGQTGRSPESLREIAKGINPGNEA